MSTPTVEESSETAESGSTIGGVVSALLALFFVYTGSTRLWRWFRFDIPDYLLLGLTYIVIGLIATGFAVYGLSSKRTGATVLARGSPLVGAITWLIALYYWVQGQFLGGTVDDIFNALVFGFTGIVLYIISYGSMRVFKQRGIIEDNPVTDSGADTDSTDVELSESIDEIHSSWEDGSERGERIAERINSIGPTVVDALPAWVWSVGVLLGCLFSLSVWVTAGAENDTAMGIGIIAGGALLFFSVMIDAHRVNWQYDLDFRWWFYSLLAFLPLFGWIFGLLWLWRKRRKTSTELTHGGGE